MTEASITYEYAADDRLEQRNTYFYSKFHGAEFIHAWEENRERLQSPASQDEPVQSESGISSPTRRLLEGLLRDVESVDFHEALSILDTLVQRFEVTKRLHGSYNAAWRPVDVDDYRDLTNYVLFGEVLQQAYALTAALPYLNTLLKCMDTLTSLQQQLPASLHPRLAELRRQEREHVHVLAVRLGVSL